MLARFFPLTPIPSPPPLLSLKPQVAVGGGEGRGLAEVLQAVPARPPRRSPCRIARGDWDNRQLFAPVLRMSRGSFRECRCVISAASLAIQNTESRIKTLPAGEQRSFGLGIAAESRCGLGQNAIGFLEPVTWSVLRSTQPPNWPYVRFHRQVLSGPLDSLIRRSALGGRLGAKTEGGRTDRSPTPPRSRTSFLF